MLCQQDQDLQFDAKSLLLTTTISAFAPVWCCTKHQSWHLACSIVRASALVSFSEISAFPCLFQPMTPYLCVWSPKISQEQKIPRKSFHWPFASRIHRADEASFENPRRSRAPADIATTALQSHSEYLVSDSWLNRAIRV